jgi:hypothetical protein
VSLYQAAFGDRIVPQIADLAAIVSWPWRGISAFVVLGSVLRFPALWAFLVLAFS